MRLARVRIEDRPRLAAVVGQEVHLLETSSSAALGDDLTAVAAEPASIDAFRRAIRDRNAPLPLSETRLLAPIDRPGKIVAIGRNYAGHTAEERASLPSEPLIFAKFPSSIIGPDEAITWDRRLTDAVDVEAELAVVIGRAARCVTRSAALHHVFGYVCLNDVSARDLQFGDGQWVRGKSLDTFCPIGPWIVTADELPDPQALAVNCLVSGERLQVGSTADMHFGVAELIHRLSWSFTLEPGDIIATGTPEGVGYYRDPPRLLRDGDVVEVEIAGIGTLRNPVVTR